MLFEGSKTGSDVFGGVHSVLNFLRIELALLRVPRLILEHFYAGLGMAIDAVFDLRMFVVGNNCVPALLRVTSHVWLLDNDAFLWLCPR